MNDKDIIGNKKHLYDETVEYDETNLPKILKEYVELLKEYDKNKDWVSYDMKFDEFEMILRAALRKGAIKDYDYEKLCAKYGWLYD